jgi:hypothetical protein
VLRVVGVPCREARVRRIREVSRLAGGVSAVEARATAMRRSRVSGSIVATSAGESRPASRMTVWNWSMAALHPRQREALKEGRRVQREEAPARLVMWTIGEPMGLEKRPGT